MLSDSHISRAIYKQAKSPHFCIQHHHHYHNFSSATENLDKESFLTYIQSPFPLLQKEIKTSQTIITTMRLSVVLPTVFFITTLATASPQPRHSAGGGGGGSSGGNTPAPAVNNPAATPVEVSPKNPVAQSVAQPDNPTPVAKTAAAAAPSSPANTVKARAFGGDESDPALTDGSNPVPEDPGN